MSPKEAWWGEEREHKVAKSQELSQYRERNQMFGKRERVERREPSCVFPPFSSSQRLKEFDGRTLSSSVSGSSASLDQRRMRFLFNLIRPLSRETPLTIFGALVSGVSFFGNFLFSQWPQIPQMTVLPLNVLLESRNYLPFALDTSPLMSQSQGW